MLTHLKITNYQAQRSLELPLGRVTSLVGPTDAGKSAVLRALWWALANSGPTNPGHHGTTETEVAVTLADGTRITRRRSLRSNGYTVEPTGGPVSTYNAIRFDVPIQVADLLNVHQNSYQRQHDGAFWLSASAAEVGRFLNSVVDLDVIDVGLTFAKKLESGAKAQLEAIAKSIEATDAAVAKLNWVDAAIADWRNYEKISRQWEATGDIVRKVSKNINEAANLTARARELSSRYSDALGVVKVQGALDLANKNRNEISTTLAKAENKLLGLRGEAEAVQTILSYKTQVVNSRDQLKRLLADVERTRTAYTTARTRYEETVKTAALCPTCGKPL